MDNKTFVANAKSYLGAGYIFGAKGQIATEALLAVLVKRYPKEITPAKQMIIRKLWILPGKIVMDCSGLLTTAAEIAEMDSADIMNHCRDQGTLPPDDPESVIPKTAGIIVYRLGHIGISLGDGTVIESAGTSKGVIISRLSDPGTGTKWTRYGYWNAIIE